MAVMQMRVTGPFSQRAIHFVRLVTFDFDLNGCVADGEALSQYVDDRLQDLLALPNCLFGYEDVAAASNDTWPHGPDVKVVHIQDSRHSRDGSLHCTHV